MIRSLLSIVDIVRQDNAKAIRFAAAGIMMVPVGSVVFWLFLQTDLRPAVANILAVSLAAVPNYLLNRYWVWQKTGAHSMSREVGPFLALAFLGIVLSSLFVWAASMFTDENVVFLIVNVTAFGIVWVFRFFVIEKFLFGEHTKDLRG